MLSRSNSWTKTWKLILSHGQCMMIYVGFPHPIFCVESIHCYHEVLFEGFILYPLRNITKYHKLFIVNNFHYYVIWLCTISSRSDLFWKWCRLLISVRFLKFIFRPLMKYAWFTLKETRTLIFTEFYRFWWKI